MRLQEFMSTGVETIDEAETAGAARVRMQGRRIRHLVVTSGGVLRGIVSDRDLAVARGDSPRARRTVGELMTGSVVTARPDTTVREAANLLRGRVIGCLPVLDDRGRLAGIVTISDLLDLLGRGAERPVARSGRRTLHKRGPRRVRSG